MIEHVDRVFAHDRFNGVEILDHAASGPVILDWAADGDLEPVRVTVHPGAFAGMVRKYVSRFKAEMLANLHGRSRGSFAPEFKKARVAVRINREELVVAAVVGEAAPMSLNTGLYEVSFDGQPQILPSVGGITPNVRVGHSAFAFMADHAEPGVTLRHPDAAQNTALNTLACIGNEAVVVTGDAKGERGRVTGKHGGVEHVMVDFHPDVMRKMTVGDRVQIWSCGLGMRLLDAPGVKAFNADPDLFAHMSVDIVGGRVRVRVAATIPAAVMGSGLGRSTVVRGDYDIQTFDDATAQEHGLRDLRLGDIVAIVDADHSFGRHYRTGAVSVGVVVHGRSFVAGHGPGVTTLLTSTKGEIDVERDADANLATILKL